MVYSATFSLCLFLTDPARSSLNMSVPRRKLPPEPHETPGWFGHLLLCKVILFYTQSRGVFTAQTEQPEGSQPSEILRGNVYGNIYRHPQTDMGVESYKYPEFYLLTGFFPQVSVSCSSNRANGLGSRVSPSQLMDVSVDGANLLPRQSTTAFASLSFQRAMIREDKQC